MSKKKKEERRLFSSSLVIMLIKSSANINRTWGEESTCDRSVCGGSEVGIRVLKTKVVDDFHLQLTVNI